MAEFIKRRGLRREDQVRAPARSGEKNDESQAPEAKGDAGDRPRVRVMTDREKGSHNAKRAKKREAAKRTREGRGGRNDVSQKT